LKHFQLQKQVPEEIRGNIFALSKNLRFDFSPFFKSGNLLLSAELFSPHSKRPQRGEKA
jgi:hypothetical protein